MQITASKREKQGTGASRRLRHAGSTPGIIYGGESEPQLIELSHNPLWYALQNEAFHSSVLEIDVDGDVQKVLLRDVQYHPYKQLVLHVDFQRVDAKTRLRMGVPVHYENADESPAVKVDKQVLSIVANEIEVTCLPSDLPEGIKVDLVNLQKDQVLRLRDIKLPRGVLVSKTLLTANPVLVSASPAPAEELSEDEAAQGDAAAE